MQSHKIEHNPSQEPESGVQPTGENPTKHTSGPWLVTGDYVIQEKDSGSALAIAAVINIPRFVGGQEATDANAHLIAAAPELLEALKAIVHTQGGSYSIRERDVALAAISKAEGRHV